MKVLFIGGTGNISETCARLLAEGGHQVTVVTRGQSPVPPDYQQLRADRRKLKQMQTALQGRDLEIVVNFLGYDIPDLDVDYAVLKDRVRQYVFISSATVYAKPPPHLPITENGPFGNPWWEYAQKKLACEEWLKEKAQATGFPVTIVRPSHTYSQRWIPNPVSSSSYTFARRFEEGRPVYIHDDGETPWTLTHTSDFAIGLQGLLGNQAAIGESFHITGDEVHTWNQLYAEIASALGVDMPEVIKVPTDFICQVAPQFTGTMKGDKAHPGVFDNSKIKRVVPEFRTKKFLSQGLRESVEWLRGHPEHQNLKPELDEVVDRVIQAWKAADLKSGRPGSPTPGSVGVCKSGPGG
jgi:nucleoside-diphosphate-sugar epimerase